MTTTCCQCCTCPVWDCGPPAFDAPSPKTNTPANTPIHAAAVATLSPPAYALDTSRKPVSTRMVRVQATALKGEVHG